MSATSLIVAAIIVVFTAYVKQPEQLPLPLCRLFRHLQSAPKAPTRLLSLVLPDRDSFLRLKTLIIVAEVYRVLLVFCRFPKRYFVSSSSYNSPVVALTDTSWSLLGNQQVIPNQKNAQCLGRD